MLGKHQRGFCISWESETRTGRELGYFMIYSPTHPQDIGQMRPQDVEGQSKFMKLIEQPGQEALLSKIQPGVNPTTKCCLFVLHCTLLEVSMRREKPRL